jgi:Uma2 family endonuclease
MSAVAKTRLSSAEYLQRERAAEFKTEYIAGQLYAMTGASREHNLATVNLAATLHAQLRQRPCEVYTADMRVGVSRRAYLYPDVVVVCGGPQFEDAEPDTLLNPTLIIEVLSPSTANYDLGEKFEYYRGVPALQEYLLVAQDKCHVLHYVRQPDDTWLLAETRDLDSRLHLPSLGCQLALADVYARVLPPSAADSV